MFSTIFLAFGMHYWGQCTSQLETLGFLPSGKVTSKVSEGGHSIVVSSGGVPTMYQLICKTALTADGKESVPYTHAAEGKREEVRCKAA